MFDELKRVKIDYNQELLNACEQGDVERVERALNRPGGADVECRDEFGYTPLILASRFGHSDVVRLLLDHSGGADVNAVDNYGASVLFGACYWGRPECAEILLDAGADWRAAMEMTHAGREKYMKPFLQKILQKREERRERAKTTYLCIRRLVHKDIAKVLADMIWKNKNEKDK